MKKSLLCLFVILVGVTGAIASEGRFEFAVKNRSDEPIRLAIKKHSQLNGGSYSPRGSKLKRVASGQGYIVEVPQYTVVDIFDNNQRLLKRIDVEGNTYLEVKRRKSFSRSLKVKEATKESLRG